MNLVDIPFFASVFVTLFVIIDPPGVIPVFVSLTSAMTAQQRKRIALIAVAVAMLIISIFAVFGQVILSYMSISLPALQFSGGLLLLLIALQLLAGKESEIGGSEGVNVALVPLGTPLLGGPGAIVAMMLFVQQAEGSAPKFLAIGLATLAMALLLYATLRFCDVIARLLGPGGVTLLTRIFGVLLAAISTQMIFDAIRSFLADWGMLAGV